MRLFVAADVPGSVKDAIEAQVVGPLREALPTARWTRPEGRHLTLQFLGEVADERIDEVAAALAGLAPARSRFDVAFDRVGGFPSLKRPRVLWVGIGPGADGLRELASAVHDALEPLGFERERRPYRGHLTLARFKLPAPVGELPPTEVPGGLFDIGGVTLFRSQLHPDGARYTALERVALTG